MKDYAVKLIEKIERDLKKQKEEANQILKDMEKKGVGK